MSTPFSFSPGESPRNLKPKNSYIDAQTYCDLAISPRKLERMRDLGKGVIGLRDVETGERFVVDAKTLVKHEVSGAS